ncbi:MULTISPECIES: hypothetical protein [unclassified Streptomyces]|uniref:hypothetical protein n=1 Tax=unclassified Streptomyces TaxID=2593676 RepID=UPI000BACA8FA|nr:MULTISPECIES: hypothetical protein [unclassified Streptomyces]ASY32399.1 hypothetical protein CAC01_06510 [Streptomyces sp. CLI2509]MYX19053.1 hypothetical protein [Streptomyces sp. SID8380]
MIRFEGPAPEQETYPLRPLPGTENVLSCSVSGTVLDLLGLSPADAAALDLRDVFRLLSEAGV